MQETPRQRRLRSDRRALEQLKAESSVFDFAARGELPDRYTLLFHGHGAWRPEQSTSVLVGTRHEVFLRLGAAYPRMMPELTWRSPIFHPNISASGVVCLGGYGTYWVPGLSLDELCTMLWDMIRYANFDPNSPYNREAASWAKSQAAFRFPLDPRPIRDKVAQPPPARNSSSTPARVVAPPPVAVQPPRAAVPTPPAVAAAASPPVAAPHLYWEPATERLAGLNPPARTNPAPTSAAHSPTERSHTAPPRAAPGRPAVTSHDGIEFLGEPVIEARVVESDADETEIVFID